MKTPKILAAVAGFAVAHAIAQPTDVPKASCEPKPAYPADELWNLEYALTARVVWFPALQMEGNRRIYHSINHSRFVRIHDEWLIDTLILHHVAAWARRISNGVEAEILARRDVAGMWRNILPWARDNRFSFMMDLFGSTAAEPCAVPRRSIGRRISRPCTPSSIRSWIRASSTARSRRWTTPA